MLHGAHGRAVFLAVPAYQGVSAATAFALFESAREVDAEIAVLAHCCHVDDARNMLVRQFLDSDADDLVFIDTDLSWEPGALSRLLSHDADIVAGSYPLKQHKLWFPLRWLEGHNEYEIGKLLEVKAAPTGFMRVRRRVFEELSKTAVKFRARDDDMHDTAILFERGFVDDIRCGGDYHFCFKAREAGFKVHVDPELYFEHAQAIGSLGAWLRKRSGAGLSYALSRVRDAEDDSDLTRACREIYSAWDNKWALIPPGLVAVARLAQGARTILECGSGASTLVMAAANPDCHVHALEDKGDWADLLEAQADRYGLTNITVYRSQVVKGPKGPWYEIPADLPQHFDMVLCDGPAYHQEDGTVDHTARDGLMNYLADRVQDAVLVFDDVHHHYELFYSYPCRVQSGKIGICKPERRKAA